MPTTKTTTAPTRWLSAREAVRHGIPRRRLGQLVRLGLIRTWKLPPNDAPTKFNEADVLRLLPATVPDRGGPP
jgi:hypothetical protein